MVRARFATVLLLPLLAGVAAAQSQMGVPYVAYQATPGVGFDCSGLTSYAWGQAGLYLPHQSRAQAK